MNCCHVVWYVVLGFGGGCLGSCSLGLCKLLAEDGLDLSGCKGVGCKVVVVSVV